MQDLHDISSSQFANGLFQKVDENFDRVKTAIDAIEQNGGGSGGGSGSGGKQEGLPELQVKRIKTYKVLVLSNSFGSYPNYPFGQIATLLGLDATTYGYNIFATAGASMADVYSKISANSSTSVALAYGDGAIATNSGYRSALAHDWDAVIFHQNSDNAANYSTYSALANLTQAVRSNCTNPRVKIGFQMIWDKKHGTSSTQRAQILANALAVLQDYDVDFIVPTGTAFELAWADETASTKMVLDNSGHPNNGFTEYLACATWYQCLFSQFADIDIDSVTPMANMAWQGYSGLQRSLTKEDALLAAKLAKAACGGSANGSSSGGGGGSGDTTQESDPIFMASPAYGITAQDIAAWNAKQEQLVSGTNVKTLDGESILGSGNLSLSNAVFGKLQNGSFYKGTYDGAWQYSANAETPAMNKVYVDVQNNKIYRYNVSAGVGSYVEVGGITIDSTITSDGTNPVTGGAIYTALSGKADAVAVVNVMTAGNVSQELEPNKFYKFGSVNSLSLTLASGTGFLIYAGKFTASSSWGGTGLSLPASVTEASGNDTIAAGKTYEFSILDNIIVVKEVA